MQKLEGFRILNRYSPYIKIKGSTAPLLVMVAYLQTQDHKMHLQFQQFWHVGIRFWYAISTEVIVIQLTAITRRSKNIYLFRRRIYWFQFS